MKIRECLKYRAQNERSPCQQELRLWRCDDGSPSRHYFQTALLRNKTPKAHAENLTNLPAAN